MSSHNNEGASNRHMNQPLLAAGAPLRQARAVVLGIHGRGASARDILALAAEALPAGTESRVALLAPQAAGGTWYPNRFIAPVAQNEPWLTWALERVHGVVEQAVAAGIPEERILLLGFSQGACLALEAAARRPARYGGVAALSGALIENGDAPRTYAGTLAGTPVFLGCADVDSHIPLARVKRSETLLAGLGAAVTTRIYTGLGHAVNEDELTAVREMVKILSDE